MSHGDSETVFPQDQSYPALQQVRDAVDGGVGQLKALDVGLTGSTVDQSGLLLGPPPFGQAEETALQCKPLGSALLCLW